jgi:hypothetical protein
METTVNTNQLDGFIWPIINMWSHIEKTSKLSASARNMLDVFVAFMRTEDNLVYFCNGGMEEYLLFCSKNLQLNYTEKTVRNAISELNNAELLIRSRKDIYYINPRYFFKWHDKLDHRKLITNIQERTGITIFDSEPKEVIIQKKEDQSTSENNIT